MSYAVRVSLDCASYKYKPDKKEVGAISKRIAQSKGKGSLYELADYVGNQGHTWAPAIFRNERKSSDIEEIQLIALDFDNKENPISFDEALARCNTLHLPIAFAYETFSSINRSKFRIVFRYEEPIYSTEFYNIIIRAFMEIFPEADKSCKDICRMYFGGKGLIGDVSDAVVRPEEIFSGLYYVYSEDPKTKVSKIERFCRENRIAVQNKAPYMLRIPFEVLGKNTAEPVIYNKKPNGSFSADEEVFVIYRSMCGNSAKSFSYDMLAPLKAGEIRGINAKDCYNVCGLIKDFCSGVYIHYEERWGILTNMVHISGGLQFYRKLLDRLCGAYIYEDEQIRKMFCNCTQISKTPYWPARCSGYCRYKDVCRHGKNIIQTAKASKNKIVELDNVVKYASLEEARKKLYKAALTALKKPDKDIHIIKAQTGIGKTYTYIKCIKELKINCIIAVPTNALKEEVLRRMKKEGIDAVATPSFPDDISEEDTGLWESCLNKGDRYGYKKLKRRLKEQYPSFAAYTQEVWETMNYQGNIVTTHVRLMNQFEGWMINDHYLIIDEDIMQSVFNCGAISVEQINRLLERTYITGFIRGRLKYYSTSDEGEVKIHLREDTLSVKKIEKNLSEDTGVTFDLYKFLNCKATVVANGVVNYAWITDLPSSKVIIMSATADKKVYAAFFKNRHIEYYDIPEVKYTGKIFQWVNQSFSRRWMSDHTDEVEMLKEKYQDCYEICFKKFETDSTDLHFGNTQGMDSYSDKDLVILGTPFPNDIMCRLMAAAADYDMKIVNEDKLNFREVQYFNYKFFFTTFEDEFMKSLHIYHIQSELEQAIGRARLLNNDNTVYVYSRFPAKQANFIYDSIQSNESQSDETEKEAETQKA